MKNVLKIFIIPIIVVLIGASFTYLINKQVVDIRYTLSENIPISISNETSSQNVQQLVIKNLGNSKAEKIIVNIQGTIKSYQLIKYSESDKEEKFDKSDRIQIIYPELPPQGILKVIITSEGKGIDIDDVVISHDKGKAIEALSNENPKSPWAMIGVILIYIFLILYIARMFFIDRLQNNAEHSSKYITILKKKNSPFYLNENRWERLRKDAINTMESGSFYWDIKQSNYYKILSRDRPEYLDDNEWDEILIKYSKKLEEFIGMQAANICYSTDDLVKILNLERPQHFQEDGWTNIRKKILVRMEIVIRDSDLHKYDKEIEGLESYKLLNDNKPQYLNDNEWNEFSKKLSESLDAIIFNEVTVKLAYFNEISSFFKIKRPQNYNVNKWDELMEKLYDMDILIKKYKAIAYEIYFKNIELIKELKKEKINELPEKYWAEYRGFIKKLYHFNIKFNIYTQKNPIKFLNNQLNEEMEIQKKDAYSVQLMNLHIKCLEEGYQHDLTIEKPTWINNEDYNRIMQYLESKQNLITLIGENKKERDNLEKDKLELFIERNTVKELKDKITNQLDIINGILSDNTVIERIENYNMVFSKGNFDNLKKIASLLSKDNGK